MPDNLPKPTELGFADFVSQLITETLHAIVTSSIQQEKQIKELEDSMALDIDEFAERFITEEMVRDDILRIFPSTKEGISSVDHGSDYAPKNGNGEENPSIYSLIGYSMSAGDFETLVYQLSKGNLIACLFFCKK